MTSLNQLCLCLCFDNYISMVERMYAGDWCFGLYDTHKYALLLYCALTVLCSYTLISADFETDTSITWLSHSAFQGP
jgi:hypothetical protein